MRTVFPGGGRALSPEPGAGGCRLGGRAGRHLRPGSSPNRPTRAPKGRVRPGASRVGDPVNTRGVTTGWGPGETDPRALPRQRPLAPGRSLDPAGSARPQPGPSPRALPPQPARPQARSPRIRWLPHCTEPASVLRGRRGSGFGSGSGRCPGARPPPGTGRPAPPADPPRARGSRRQPEAGGAEQAARQAWPIQPPPAWRGAAAEMGGRLVRSVKGAAAHRAAGAGR